MEKIKFIDGTEAVLVVRCKECKNKDTYCDYCHKLEMNIKADDFCSYGERRVSDDKPHKCGKAYKRCT